MNCFQTLYLWPTDNNNLSSRLTYLDVVNCFQTLYLWPTDNNDKALTNGSSSVVNCFQTLYLWPTDNNQCASISLRYEVVNCFQTLYLWPTDNNWLSNDFEVLRLWIAFKLCIFDLLITMKRPATALSFSCELLSNFVSLTYW